MSVAGEHPPLQVTGATPIHTGSPPGSECVDPGLRAQIFAASSLRASNAQVAFVEVERDLGRRVAQEPTTARLYEREAYAVRVVTPTASTVTLPERFDVLAHVRTVRQGEVISTGRIVTPEGEHTLRPGERLIVIIRPDRFRAADWVVRSVVPVDRASDTITMGAFSLPAGTSAREVIAGLRAEALRVPSPGGAASNPAGGE